MHYNICVVRPPGYAHSGAFTELAEVVAYGLDDLGHTVHISENAMMPDARNLLIGCHLADPDATAHVPDDTIVINTEQIHVDEQPWNEKIYRWASRYETWDYSERNLAKLRRLGIAHARYLKLGFHPALRRIPHDVEQDIDVLFYGTIGPRRAAILDALQARGLTVGIVSGGIYGAPRDAAIARESRAESASLCIADLRGRARVLSDDERQGRRRGSVAGHGARSGLCRRVSGGTVRRTGRRMRRAGSPSGAASGAGGSRAGNDRPASAGTRARTAAAAVTGCRIVMGRVRLITRGRFFHTVGCHSEAVASGSPSVSSDSSFTIVDRHLGPV